MYSDYKNRISKTKFEFGKHISRNVKKEKQQNAINGGGGGGGGGGGNGGGSK